VQESPVQPLASIIVLYMAGSPWVGRCLDSLRRNIPQSTPHELIIVGNGVSEEPALPTVGNGHVRFLRTEANLGFGGGCNWAARFARGRYVVLLNDDTAIEPGWLEALIDAAETHPGAGAVGSLVLSPDGTIEEAGRVLWRDGVSHGVGATRRSPSTGWPDVYEVDCCSASSLLVRRSDWEAIGGFDERYFPAYYEDTDLCLSLRTRGRAVMCATASRVRHEGSASTSLLWRRFLGLRNHRILAAKWSPVLTVFDVRPRDEPSIADVERTARHASRRRQDIYHTFGMSPHRHVEPAQNPGASDTVALLQTEVTHLKMELRLKDEYIAHLVATKPEMERGLGRVLEDERRQARRRERIRAIPVVGRLATWVKRRIDEPRHSQS